MRKDIPESYEILREENLPDIHSQGTLLRHRKTGARVMLIENDDENKVFNIAFRTTPKDSTGVAHITEHSVLCGSRDFPLKDPFVELVKGSLNTFLNAMTYPDKTCYPVASCNDQDFQNLMHVYLDAVFYPNIYKKEEIFRQEGWHYHLEDTEGPLTISGVVYNEMKGAFSSPDDVLEREIMNSLFPDTTYGCESGGDPDVIPDLTYEGFLDFHRTYYHPSNSFIFLYGNMNMAEKLDFLDHSYLSAFDALSVESTVPLQAPFAAMKEAEKVYPVSENESEKDNTYLSWNLVMGEVTDTKVSMAMDVLDYALLSSQGAPLKQALLDAGIGKDIYGSYESGILQPYFSVIAKGANPEQKDEFVSVIRRTLEEIAEKGIDPLAIEAGLNSMEFRYREADYSSYPKGLFYSLDILGTWLYDAENPFAEVQQLPVFEELRALSGTGYFENLIRTYFLDNTHGSVLVLKPEKGLAARKDQALAEKLEAFRAGLSREELENMVKRTEDLEAYQESEEDPEALSCIPSLKRTDIRKESTPLTNKELDLDGNLFLFHDVQTNGIAYFDLMFETGALDARSIHTISMLKSVLAMVNTSKHSYAQLNNEINAGTGGIACGVEVFENADPEGGYRAMFSVRGKALYSQMKHMFSLIREILTESDLTDKKRLYEIVNQVKSHTQAGLVSAGHGTAVLRAGTYSSGCAWFQDELTGVGFYRYLETLTADFEKEADSLIEELQKILKKVLRQDNFCVSFTGEESALPEAMEYCREMKKSLSTEPAVSGESDYRADRKNEGFTTSGQVQYVAQAGSFAKNGYRYTGALDILKVILSYDYLWMNLRVKGGAYGCMSGFKRNGNSYFVSYRDPHLERTLDVFRGIPEFVRQFTADEDQMNRYIIGTISSKDIPRTPQMQGSISRAAYFDGVTDEMIQKTRDEILNATQDDIRALAPLIEEILSDEMYCVVGSETKVTSSVKELKQITPLISGDEEEE